MCDTAWFKQQQPSGVTVRATRVFVSTSDPGSVICGFTTSLKREPPCLNICFQSGSKHSHCRILRRGAVIEGSASAILPDYLQNIAVANRVQLQLSILRSDRWHWSSYIRCCTAPRHLLMSLRPRPSELQHSAIASDVLGVVA